MGGLRQEVEEGEKAQTQPLELNVEGECRVEGGIEAGGQGGKFFSLSSLRCPLCEYPLVSWHLPLAVRGWKCAASPTGSFYGASFVFWAVVGTAHSAGESPSVPVVPCCLKGCVPRAGWWSWAGGRPSAQQPRCIPSILAHIAPCV